MAKFELKLPKMGESVAEATLNSWLKDVGDHIDVDEAVVEISTDKVDSDVPSEVRGILIEKKFEVEVADASGHSVVEMTQSELAAEVTGAQGSWVFVNDQLVSAADIADMNLEAGSRIRLMPGLIGGRAC